MRRSRTLSAYARFSSAATSASYIALTARRSAGISPASSRRRLHGPARGVVAVDQLAQLVAGRQRDVDDRLPRRGRLAPRRRRQLAAEQHARLVEEVGVQPAQVGAAGGAGVDRGARARGPAPVGEHRRPALLVARVGGHPRPLAPRRQRERVRLLAQVLDLAAAGPPRRRRAGRELHPLRIDRDQPVLVGDHARPRRRQRLGGDHLAPASGRRSGTRRRRARRRRPAGRRPVAALRQPAVAER